MKVTPAVVLTSGRLPLIRRGTLVVDIEPGTSISTDRLEVGAPITGVQRRKGSMRALVDAGAASNLRRPAHHLVTHGVVSGSGMAVSEKPASPRPPKT